jgi:hypothetical protein
MRWEPRLLGQAGPRVSLLAGVRRCGGRVARA